MEFPLVNIRLFVCTLLISAAGVISVVRGAGEPWASKTDPTDIARSHVQDVTTAPFTYNVTQGGTIDGNMCTTLPGVWEPYEQTWESNRSLRMENVGAANVINPWLTIGPIDFFSQQTIANSVTAGLATDREKALALFYFYITHRFHKGNGDNGAQGDVSQAMNVFGFNTCGNSTLCMADLLDNLIRNASRHSSLNGSLNLICGRRVVKQVHHNRAALRLVTREFAPKRTVHSCHSQRHENHQGQHPRQAQDQPGHPRWNPWRPGDFTGQTP